MSEAEAFAWAAGLFEGEGSIQIRHNMNKGKNPLPVMELQMTDEDVVRGFASVVGGTVAGPYERPNRKPNWRWQLAGRDVAAVLVRMLPFLGRRRTEKALAAIDAALNLKAHPGWCRKDGSCCQSS